MEVLGRGGVSYERGNPVPPTTATSTLWTGTRGARWQALGDAEISDYWLLNLLKRFRCYCLTHAISKTMIRPCPSSVLVPRDAARRCAWMKPTARCPPHSTGLPRHFRPMSGRKSVTLSVGTPPCPYPIAYRRVYRLSTSGLFKKSLCSPLCGYVGGIESNLQVSFLGGLVYKAHRLL